jgi:hypothetical protein
MLAMKWDSVRQNKHKNKIKSTKPTVDDSAPKRYVHLYAKMKTKQMEKGAFVYIERALEIAKSNKILVEKMTYIMDLEAKDPRIHESSNYPLRDQLYERHREQAKIRADNRALVLRLAKKEGHYNQKDMAKQRLQNLQYLANISKFPERVHLITRSLRLPNRMRKQSRHEMSQIPPSHSPSTTV